RLTGRELHGIYGEYSTGNLELRGYLTWRFGQPAGNGNFGVPPGEPLFPTLFRTPGSFPRDPVLPANISPDQGVCMVAYARIYADPDNADSSILAIENAVGRVAAQHDPSEELTWDPALFAGAAAKALIRRGDTGHAKRLIELGLKVKPQDAKLRYLERIIERR
ncbi:MAG: hypothetical protein H7X97_06785, partial [Opitutaceae bacterium]|nr:hypothetical protein [Verrucomicrobiales bacterium]